MANPVRYPCLLAGGVMSLFAVHATWDIPPLAWLFPVFLLRFSRSTRPWPAVGWLTIVQVADLAFWLFQADLESPAVLLAAMALLPLLVAPYVVDRLVTPSLDGLLATLVFPTAKVTAELALSATPFGTVFGVLGATQATNLPLIQVASVTGVYGVSFILAWAAAVVVHWWESGWRRARRPLAALVVALVVVIGGGAIRLLAGPPATDSVRIAGVSASRAAAVALAATLRPFNTLQDVARADPQVVRAGFHVVNDDLLASTEQQAAAGARIVVWPESAGQVLESDEPELLARAGEIARRYRAFLDLGMSVYTERHPHLRNQMVLLSPDGEVVWKYQKAHPVPILEPYEAGEGELPIVDTPFGRLSNIICYDADFPALVRQAGHAGVDILLIGANNWQGIATLHAENSVFRAIETGAAVFRQASRGIAIGYDNQGHVLGSSDYYSTDQQTLVLDMPRHGERTVYSDVGDLFAYLCLAATIAFTLRAAVAVGQVRRDGEPATAVLKGLWATICRESRFLCKKPTVQRKHRASHRNADHTK